MTIELSASRLAFSVKRPYDKVEASPCRCRPAALVSLRRSNSLFLPDLLRFSAPMSTSRTLLAAFGSMSLLVSACTSSETPSKHMSRDQYEAVSLALFRRQTSGKWSSSDFAAFYKEHQTMRHEFEAAISEYGKAESIRREEQRMIDKYRVGDVIRHNQDEMRRRERLELR
jgi:hypothetical protein